MSSTCSEDLSSDDSDSSIESDAPYSPAGAYRCANRKSLLEKRDKLLKRKKIPQRELAKTLVALNDTRPVNTLPRELLIYVIEYLSPSDAPHVGNWLPQLYVCRRWYEIITTMPSLWREIYVSASPEWLELCLSRCAGMTADLHFTGRFSLQSTILTLEEHGHLVRTITYSVLRSSWASDIPQLLAIPLPALEKIEVSLQTQSKRFAFVDLPPESYARLQSLCLRSCNAPLDCAAYASLRILEITHSQWSISFNQLLDIFLSANRLQKLVLDDCLSKLKDCPGGFPKTHPPRRPPTTLPRLKRLRLTTVRSSLGAQILAHIRVPNATWIEVRTYANSDHPQPSVWGLLPPNPSSFSPIFSTATSLVVGFRDSNRCELDARSDTRRLTMQVYLGWHRQFSDTWQAMDGFLNTFADAPLTDLTVSSDAHRVSGATWEHVFRSVPTLRHLEVGNRKHIGTVFATLRSASEHGGGIMCCPELSTIHVWDHSWGYERDPFPKAAADQVLEALRGRAERGFKLRELKVFLRHCHWAQRGSYSRKEYLAALRNSVSKVCFED